MMPQHKDDGVTAELHATRTADPAKELQKAIQKQDYRFLGVAGFGLMVPGAPTDRQTLLVRIHGVHVIEGTSDYIQSPEHGSLQPVAAKHAERYNRLLLAFIGRGDDPAIDQARRKIEQELVRLERSDPIEDAKKAVNEAPPFMAIIVPGGSSDRSGIGKEVKEKAILAGAFRSNLWEKIFITEIMNPDQRQRLDRLITSYAAPFDRYLFAHYDEIMRNKRR